MSDQGALPDGRESDFGLIETLLWTRGEGFHLLAEHLARLAASSAALGFAHDEAQARDALNAAVAGASSGRLRARLVLARDGTIETSVTPIEPIPPGTVWRVAVAERRFSSADPLLRHKTTRRALYEDALAEAAQRCGADEVLFQNEHDELCEAARCNLFVPANEILLTPPLSCGLLPGTLRAALIAQGRARESILRLEDISGSEFFLGNSVRGLVRARLVD
ncbi:aminotransferase class IV [Methylocystis hirsuta]|uniref:Probable branched-chain-amino-acid aminotransferase n=1 Tax=Methylocystis hirsuta TaxID=369798 RepID=A0A3M9XS68_9HYPH|nr:aminotransferase class IV [Methylocystis hirsuta]RNJ50871.1 aminotransferase class IV [Methylocystis hirsuta]